MSDKGKSIQNNEEIRKAILRELEWEPAIKSKDISVKVSDGCVTLSGFTHSYLEKASAERAAKSVYGVRSLANDIEVKPVLERSAPEIARDILHAFKVLEVVPEDRIYTIVRDGFVTWKARWSGTTSVAVPKPRPTWWQGFAG